MSTKIKPGQVWAWQDTYDARGPHGSLFEIVEASPDAPAVAYQYRDVPGYDPERTITASAEIVRVNAHLVKDATPAPLDPSKVKAGDTVRVHVIEGRNEYDVHGKVWEPGMEAPAGLSVGNVSLDAPNVTLTDHQPAPKPEWTRGQVAVVTPSMPRGEVTRAIRDGEGNWRTDGGGFWSDDEVLDVRPLVVIDPATVDVAHLAHVYDDAPGTERTGIRAVLAALGIEVAR